MSKVDMDVSLTPTSIRNMGQYGWRDITTQIIVRGVGATDPDWTQIGSGPFYAYKFAVNDQCWMAFHVPHDFVSGQPIYFHSHWFTDGTNTNSVKWEYVYTYAKGFNQEAFGMGSGTTVTVEQAGPGVQYQHMVAETAAVDPSITEPDGIIYVRVKRIANGGTDNTDGVFMLTSDIHYLSNSLGTPSKEPNFYYWNPVQGF